MFLCFLCSEMENYIYFSFHLLQRCKTPWGLTQRFKTRRNFLWAQKWFLCVWLYVCMCVGASCEKWTWRKNPSMGFFWLASALHKRAALCTSLVLLGCLYKFSCSLWIKVMMLVSSLSVKTHQFTFPPFFEILPWCFSSAFC